MGTQLNDAKVPGPGTFLQALSTEAIAQPFTYHKKEQKGLPCIYRHKMTNLNEW
jgi:hypothetical protein